MPERIFRYNGCFKETKNRVNSIRPIFLPKIEASVTGHPLCILKNLPTFDLKQAMECLRHKVPTLQSHFLFLSIENGKTWHQRDLGTEGDFTLISERFGFTENERKAVKKFLLHVIQQHNSVGKWYVYNSNPIVSSPYTRYFHSYPSFLIRNQSTRHA